MAELVTDLESIGWNCEFGAVQRCFGAEPLGLLRFSGAKIDNLVQLLEGGLPDFLSAEDFGMEVQGSDEEYVVFSRRYGDFYSHTHAYVCRDAQADVFAREFKKMAYLKRRFEQDWLAAARIYVHSGCEDEAPILKLHAALRARSDCVLLWVVRARSQDKRGKVEILAPGLWKGYVADYAAFHDGLRVDLPGWGMICRSVEAIRLGLPEPTSPVPSPIDAMFSWSRGLCGELEAGPGMGHCRVVHATTRRVTVGRVRITATFPAKTLIVFSVWVRLAPAFREGGMQLKAPRAVFVNDRRADLGDAAWHQMWIVARVVESTATLDVSFEAEASSGSEFLFGGWQIEEGGVPDESLRPAETAVFEVPTPIAASPSLSHRLKRWAGRILTATGGRLQPPQGPTVPSVNGLTGLALLLTADDMIHAGLFDEADGLLLAGMLLFPSQAELLTHYAFCAQTRQTFAEAARRWGDVVARFPRIAVGHYRLSETLRECGELDRALAVIEGALPHHRDDPGMVAEAAQVYAALRRWPEALAQWDQALAMAGQQPKLREGRAIAARAMASLADGMRPAAVSLG